MSFTLVRECAAQDRASCDEVGCCLRREMVMRRAHVEESWSTVFLFGFRLHEDLNNARSGSWDVRRITIRTSRARQPFDQDTDSEEPPPSRC